LKQSSSSATGGVTTKPAIQPTWRYWTSERVRRGHRTGVGWCRASIHRGEAHRTGGGTRPRAGVAVGLTPRCGVRHHPTTFSSTLSRLPFPSSLVHCDLHPNPSAQPSSSARAGLLFPIVVNPSYPEHNRLTRSSSTNTVHPNPSAQHSSSARAGLLFPIVVNPSYPEHNRLTRSSSTNTEPRTESLRVDPAPYL
jgi:hypothetical protein